MKYGFIKVSACIPELRVADIKFNVGKIKESINQCEKSKVGVTVFPELCITGYTCGDLFFQDVLIKQARVALVDLKKYTAGKSGIYIIGVPLLVEKSLLDCAAVLHNGAILGIVPKTHVFKDNNRWFLSSKDVLVKSVCIDGEDVPIGVNLLFRDQNMTGVCFGIEIGEDLLTMIPPSSYHALAGATMIFHLSASNETVGRKKQRIDLLRQHSAKCVLGYISVSSGINESSTDMVFGGHGIIAEHGNILAESLRFSFDSQMILSEIDVDSIKNLRLKNPSFRQAFTTNDYRTVFYEGNNLKITELTKNVSPHPFIPEDQNVLNDRCEEILEIQSSALAKRIKHTGLNKAVIGVSGGLDSTLALLVTVKTMDKLGLPRENIRAITMPGFGTTDRTYDNAIALIRAFGADLREINITKASLQHFEDIGHDPNIHDTTYENVQARERTQILMDIANKEGGLVIGTGDLSEMALGWCTYNGDHMSMYSVNANVPKTLIRYIVKWAGVYSDKKVKDVLNDILDTPISPELLPKSSEGTISQKTEDIVGPYELHDFFLYHMIRYGASPEKILYLACYAFQGKYDEQTINKWLRKFVWRFFTQQFKRSCVPDGPKIGSVSLSPRGDWVMPSDAVADLWLRMLDE